MTQVVRQIFIAASLSCITQGAVIEVTNATAAGLGWNSIGNSGGGSSTITMTAPHDGLGSLQLNGDRTR